MLHLNYAKNVYDKRVDELNTYYNRLYEHVDRLEELRSQLRNCWDDDNERKYDAILSEQILAVRNAAEKTKEIKQIHEEAVAQFENLNSFGEGVIDGIKNIIGVLNIKK